MCAYVRTYAYPCALGAGDRIEEEVQSSVHIRGTGVAFNLTPIGRTSRSAFVIRRVLLRCLPVCLSICVTTTSRPLGRSLRARLLARAVRFFGPGLFACSRPV